jgi:hypothetical protein
MRTTGTITLAVLCLAIGAWLGAEPFKPASAFSYPDPAAIQPPQYTTTIVEANSLEGKIGDLARENWEIFSITTASSSIDQGADGKTHIVVDKFQVTARRPSTSPPPLKAKS